MKTYLIMVLALVSVGCSSATVKRTVETDPQMRVLIDPRIPAGHYTQIRRALVQSGKFEVVDRRDGFEAALREQDLQHRSGYADRFSDREKWAHIGDMYGAGGIVTATAECYQDKNFWGKFTRYCNQSLAMIDGRTGVVMFEVEGKNSIPWTADWVTPDWNEVVAKAVQTYPEYFKPRVVKHPLDQYMDQSEEKAKRERAKKETQAARPQPARFATTIKASDLGAMKSDIESLKAESSEAEEEKSE